MQRKDYFLKLFILLSLWPLLWACTLQPRPPQEPLPVFLEQADRLITAQHYTEAANTLEEAARLYPETPLPLLKIGQIYLWQRRWLLAGDAFNRALARDLENPVALAGLAETTLNQGYTGEALDLWQRSAGRNPDLPGVFTGLGRTHLMRLEFTEAEAAFRQQQQRQPDPEADWHLAALTAPADLSAARDALLAIPAQASADLLARRDYLLAVLVPFTAESTPVEIAQATGIALAQVELWPLAVHALTLAQSQAGQQPVEAQAETLAFLGYALTAMGRPALDLFQQAQILDPESALPPYFYGIYLRRQGALKAAEGALLQAIELDPGNAAIYVELAQTKAQQGDFAGAETYFGEALLAAEDDPAIQLLRVKFYAFRGYQLEEVGLPAAEALVKADETNAEAHDLLGWIQFLTGETQQAERSFRRALELDPALASARYHLARYLTTQGAIEAAAAEYQRVIDLDTSNIYRDQALKALQQFKD